ncbi:hypothetical protein MMC24_007464 [Lignoscripta atroalba]|nr:hypothetical protein [Lignoscripta atroalba]
MEASGERISGEHSMNRPTELSPPKDIPEQRVEHVSRITDKVLENTRLQVSLSTKSYGSVPSISSSPTIEQFVSYIITAWDLQSKESDIKAITTSFPWQQNSRGYDNTKRSAGQ